MKRSSKDSEARLFAIAETQSGFFTARQAEEAGFDRTHHAYHVRTSNWVREHRGVYRLNRFPMPERPDLFLWSLWSRNRDDQAQGIYSHQTALSIYDLSDVMPAKLHMTVPRSFRRNAEIPPILILHYDHLSAVARADNDRDFARNPTWWRPNGCSSKSKLSLPSFSPSEILTTAMIPVK